MKHGIKNAFNPSFRVAAGALLVALIAGPLAAQPYAYPVPFVAQRGDSEIIFKDLPGAGRIRIFTIAGDEVTSLPLAPGQDQYSWSVTNSAGEKLATAVYLYQIEGNGQKTTGKLIVIR